LPKAILGRESAETLGLASQSSVEFIDENGAGQDEDQEGAESVEGPVHQPLATLKFGLAPFVKKLRGSS
jgi:hypothetical protein